MERQLSALTAAFRALDARVAELSQRLAAAPVVATSPETVQHRKEEVTPEILVMITAAVTAFLGKKVRIRSAKMLQSPYELVNPWSQQGRVFVQASHNPRSRG